MREFFFATVASLILTPVLFIGLLSVDAQVMESTSYRIQSDSINFGGGFSTSTNYQLESTAGEVGTGELGSTNFKLKAGYQQMQESFISISGATPVTLSPTIVGIVGGTSNGSTTVTIITDNAAGYALTIHSEGNPAMQKGADSIANYTPSGGAPDYSFSVGVAESEFGYSPSGADIISRFMDNGVACNTGTSDTLLACWDALLSSDVTIAQSSGSNHPFGATTTVYFRVGVGNSINQPPGTYTATTTLTALTL